MSIEIERGAAAPGEGARDVWQAMARGIAQRCPACGKGPLYNRYLKVSDTCAACATPLHHHRADDAPPYFTMLVVGHVVIAGVLAVERAFAPSMLVHLALWLPLTLGLSLWLLPIVKGGLIGLQWALRMHGFGKGADPAGPDPVPAPAERKG